MMSWRSCGPGWLESLMRAPAEAAGGRSSAARRWRRSWQRRSGAAQSMPERQRCCGQRLPGLRGPGTAWKQRWRQRRQMCHMQHQRQLMLSHHHRPVSCLLLHLMSPQLQHQALLHKSASLFKAQLLSQLLQLAHLPKCPHHSWPKQLHSVASLLPHLK